MVEPKVTCERILSYAKSGLWKNILVN